MLRGGCGDLGDTGDTPLCVSVTPRKPRHCLPRGPSTLTPRSPSRTASTSPSRSGPCWLTWRRAWAPSRWVMPLTLCHPWHPQIPYRVPPCTLQLWVPYFAPQCPLPASVGAPLLSLPFDHHWVPPHHSVPVCPHPHLLWVAPRHSPHPTGCTPSPVAAPVHPISSWGAPSLPSGCPTPSWAPLAPPCPPLGAPSPFGCPFGTPMSSLGAPIPSPHPQHLSPPRFPPWQPCVPCGCPLGPPTSPLGVPILSTCALSTFGSLLTPPCGCPRHLWVPPWHLCVPSGCPHHLWVPPLTPLCPLWMLLSLPHAPIPCPPACPPNLGTPLSPVGAG